MSGDDWIGEYERAVADLQPPVPMAQWTHEQARAAARAAFDEAPSGAERERLLAEARREGRAAKTPRRLEGIRQRRPDLAAIIEEDLAWLARHTAGFAGRPFADQIAHWYEVTGIPESGGSVKSTRGTAATWPGLREAAFILLAWRDATIARAPSIGWLAVELRAVQPELDLPRGRKLARQFLAEWRDRPGAAPQIVPN